MVLRKKAYIHRTYSSSWSDLFLDPMFHVYKSCLDDIYRVSQTFENKVQEQNPSEQRVPHILYDILSSPLYRFRTHIQRKIYVCMDSDRTHHFYLCIKYAYSFWNYDKINLSDYD